eukprot:TRINITY_DN24883_c0_g1_i1.p1 TRINITY_DN24883_c0_g1~~TRINITY_DN24883_c0_g1_i1.p1  ORF type:complete len:249 (-),score=36.89 TRINITY_DN24883_c0_g1_i1:86-832(-)
MASFFGEVVAESYRYFDDEDEDALEAVRGTEFSFSHVEPRSEEKLLIVTEGRLPSSYMDVCASSLKDVGSIIGRLDNKEVKFGKVLRGDSCTVVEVEQDLRLEESHPLASLIVGLVANANTNMLCLTARHIRDYRGDVEEADNGCIVRFLSTKNFQNSNNLKRLEVPNILSGLSAAILSISTVRGIPAMLLVNYVEMLHCLDSISQVGFQSIHNLEPVKACSAICQPTNLSAQLKSRRTFQDSSNLYI